MDSRAETTSSNISLPFELPRYTVNEICLSAVMMQRILFAFVHFANSMWSISFLGSFCVYTKNKYVDGLVEPGTIYRLTLISKPPLHNWHYINYGIFFNNQLLTSRQDSQSMLFLEYSIRVNDAIMMSFSLSNFYFVGRCLIRGVCLCS